MKLTAIKTTFLATVAAVTLTSMPVPAHADIDDWLRRNFSTRDFVGDWLRDTFGGFAANGGPGKFDSPSIHQEGYQQAVEIMTTWPATKDKRADVVQVCSGEQLLKVILETKSQDKTLEKCFETSRPMKANAKAKVMPKLDAGNAKAQAAPKN